MFLPMSEAEKQQYPPFARETTAEHPWPVRLLSEKVATYVDKMSQLWVEGQVVECKRRPGARVQFLTLRDPEVEASFTVKVWSNNLPAEIVEGSRVVVECKPSFYQENGSLSLAASQMKLQGLGDLIAKIEELRKRLAAEGLFSPTRKKPLPFLPKTIGIICGRAAKAQADVVENVERRWPGMQFMIKEVSVQGPNCVPTVLEALEDLDSDPKVEVIIITRGGGSVEDLLPFSSELLIRRVAECETPVVSAIGHEEDCPLLDFVADYRASTPTDAAKRVVPDAQAEITELNLIRNRIFIATQTRLQRETETLTQLTSRPALKNPLIVVDTLSNDIQLWRERLESSWSHHLTLAGENLRTARETLRALSPLSTIERGYSVLRNKDLEVITHTEQVNEDEPLEAVLYQGRLGVKVFAKLASPDSPQ